MTFISYAQNFEDVMLWRAFKHLASGFYVDVGAADPVDGSVTKSFYDHGWHGINIEPEPGYAAALRDARPRDINLEVAIAARPGTEVFYRIAETGLSTFSMETAAAHSAAGYPQSVPMQVEVTTLKAVWEGHGRPTTHFLKIDAEGAERDVLLGADLHNFRPWLIVIEATKPFSPVRVTDQFESILLEAQYSPVWFDGLNAWYVAAEHADELRPSFQLPPNFFDGFVMGNYLAQAGRADQAEQRCRQAIELATSLQQQIDSLQQQTTSLQAELAAVTARALLAEQDLHSVLSSSSWRITAPIRRVASSLRSSRR